MIYITVLLSMFVFFIINLFYWLICMSLETDRTLGGAYLAMVLVTSPIAIIAGGIFAYLICFLIAIWG